MTHQKNIIYLRRTKLFFTNMQKVDPTTDWKCYRIKVSKAMSQLKDRIAIESDINVLKEWLLQERELSLDKALIFGLSIWCLQYPRLGLHYPISKAKLTISKFK